MKNKAFQTGEVWMYTIHTTFSERNQAFTILDILPLEQKNLEKKSILMLSCRILIGGKIIEKKFSHDALIIMIASKDLVKLC